jgi:hypothetical protein
MLAGMQWMFAAANQCAEKSFFGVHPWYHYLNAAGQLNKCCEVTSFQLLGRNSDILLVILAVVDDLLIIAGLVAVVFVIYAGIKYVMSQGSPDETSKAQSTLVNALIGLAIALIAIALVSFIGNSLAGSSAFQDNASSSADFNSLPHTDASKGTISTALTIVFGVVGALSLLFITIGGFRYVLSQGDPQAVGKAKGTILYAVVGLIVAITAMAIVTFVVGRV